MEILNFDYVYYFALRIFGFIKFVEIECDQWNIVFGLCEDYILVSD